MTTPWSSCKSMKLKRLPIYVWYFLLRYHSIISLADRGKLTTFNGHTLQEKFPNNHPRWHNYLPLYPVSPCCRESHQATLRNNVELRKQGYIHLKQKYKVHIRMLAQYEEGAVSSQYTLEPKTLLVVSQNLEIPYRLPWQIRPWVAPQLRLPDERQGRIFRLKALALKKDTVYENSSAIKCFLGWPVVIWEDPLTTRAVRVVPVCYVKLKKISRQAY